MISLCNNNNKETLTNQNISRDWRMKKSSRAIPFLYLLLSLRNAGCDSDKLFIRHKNYHSTLNGKKVTELIQEKI